MYCYSVLESTFFLMPFSDASPNSSPLWTLNLLTNASSAPFRQKCKGCVFLLFLTRQKVYCKACLLWHLFVWEYGFFMSVFVSFVYILHFLTRWLRSLQVCPLWNFCVWEYGFLMSVIVSFGFVSHFTFTRWLRSLQACPLWNFCVWEYGFFMSVFVSFGFVSHFTFIPDDWEACKSVHYETFLSVIVCVYCKLHLFNMFLLLGIACLSTMWLLGEHITSLAEVIMIITQIVSPFKTFR